MYLIVVDVHEIIKEFGSSEVILFSTENCLIELTNVSWLEVIVNGKLVKCAY